MAGRKPRGGRRRGPSRPAARPRSRAQRLTPAARRAQLLEHALRVFARRGLGAARHAEIAKAAGVSVAATFVYFPTRKALVGAVLDAVDRFFGEQAEAIHARRLPAPQTILEHATAFARSVQTHPDHAHIWLEWSTAFRDEEVWARYGAFQRRVVETLERTVRRGQREGTFDVRVDAEDEAQLLYAAAHMVAHMQFTRVPAERVERFLHSIVRLAGGRLE